MTAAKVEAIEEKLEEKIDGKRNVVNGRLTQAKGIVKEKWGELSHDDSARLAGKKDQVVGKLQADYGDSWIVRHRNWVLLGTAVTAVIAFIFLRNSTTS